MDPGPIKCDCDHCNCPSATTEGTCRECCAGLHVTGWINGEPERSEILHQVGLFGSTREMLGKTPYPDNKPGYTDDDTSKAAAEFVNQDLIHRHWSVLQQLSVLGPQTADAICHALGCSHNHIAPRMTELKHAGLIVDTGEREMTRANCLARVMAISEPGKQAIKEKGPGRR